MRGFGTAWFYKQKVANILSQFWIVTHSNWNKSYATKNYRKSRRLVEDVVYEVITSEGVKCKFKLILNGLYVLKMSENTDRCFFGKKIYDNSIDCRMAMCYAILSENADEESNDLKGVLKSNDTLIIEVNDIIGVNLTNVNETIDENDVIETVHRSR